MRNPSIRAIERIGIGKHSAFKPGEHSRFALRIFQLEIGNKHDLKLESFGLVNGHELDAEIGVCIRIGLGVESQESGVKRGADQVRVCVRELVEASEEEVDVRAGGGVDGGVAAERKPHLLEPGAERGGWLRSAEGGRGGEGLKHTLSRGAPIRAKTGYGPRGGRGWDARCGRYLLDRASRQRW